MSIKPALRRPGGDVDDIAATLTLGVLTSESAAELRRTKA
jgi:hypothetical protein